MKKLFKKDLFWLWAFIVWKIYLYIISLISPYIVVLRDGFLHTNRWLNFDGIHYLKIASEGYFQYSEAFFPLYPLLIKFISNFGLDQANAALIISNLSFLTGLFVFYRVISDFDKNTAKWTILFLLAYPSSFFFAAGYTEGLFFATAVISIYFFRKKKWILGGIFGALASATRLIGIFLVVYAFIEYYSNYIIIARNEERKTKQSRTGSPRQPLIRGWLTMTGVKNRISIKPLLGIALIPLGLVSYMVFLYLRNGDALAFFHVQPYFGANRSGSSIILLPQVYWRYLKIIFTAYLQPSAVSYFISIWELIITTFAISVFWFLRKKLDISLYLFALFVLLLPTLTGTLSSMPRYVLSAFPIFIMLAKISSIKVKTMILSIFVITSIFITSLFLQGWFVG
ncbi:hypothetical protein ACFL1A_00100 [Patescibacteria group bacterium]